MVRSRIWQNRKEKTNVKVIDMMEEREALAYMVPLGGTSAPS